MTLIRHSFVYPDLMSTIQQFSVSFYIADLKSSSIRSRAVYFNWCNCALTHCGLDETSFRKDGEMLRMSSPCVAAEWPDWALRGNLLSVVVSAFQLHTACLC